MAGITKAQAQSKLDEWMAADTAISKGKSFTKDGRSFSNNDATEILKNIEFWDRQVKRLSRGGLRVMRGVPLG